jgi:hypothetical protein
MPSYRMRGLSHRRLIWITAGSPGLGMAGAARLPSVCGRSCRLTDRRLLQRLMSSMHLVVFRNKPCHFGEAVTQLVVWRSRWGHENEASFGAVRLGWGTLPVTIAMGDL